MAEIERINKGETITAKRLNDYGDSINELNRKIVGKPKQVDEGAPPEVQSESVEEESEITSADNYIETSRSVSQVQVFDQNDTNYALIDRIDSITFTNQAGSTLTLTFNN